MITYLESKIQKLKKKVGALGVESLKIKVLAHYTALEASKTKRVRGWEKLADKVDSLIARAQKTLDAAELKTLVEEIAPLERTLEKRLDDLYREEKKLKHFDQKGCI